MTGPSQDTVGLMAELGRALNGWMTDYGVRPRKRRLGNMHSRALIPSSTFSSGNGKSARRPPRGIESPLLFGPTNTTSKTGSYPPIHAKLLVHGVVAPHGPDRFPLPRRVVLVPAQSPLHMRPHVPGPCRPLAVSLTQRPYPLILQPVPFVL